MTLSGAEREARYGFRHKKLRQALADRVARGEVICWRCGELIQPGTAWDLGHNDDGAPQKYAGAEHRKCNRSAALRALFASRTSEPRVSRDW